MIKILTNIEEERLKIWYEQFCYKNKIPSDLYDIEHNINRGVGIEENKNKIEEDLNKLMETDVGLEKDLKQKVQEQKEKQQTQEQEKKIEDYKNTLKNELDLIKRICFTSTHIVILGKRREGKTCLGFEILRWHKDLTNKEILTYRFPKPELLPKWIKNITDIKDIGCNQVILVDESSNDFHQYAYNKQSNRFLAQLLKRAGQTNTSFIFVDHNSNFLNRNMLRMIDVWMLKKNTDFAIQDERKYVSKLYERMLWEPKLDEYFVHCDDYEGILKFKKSEFFTEELSTGFDITTKRIVNMSDLVDSLKPNLPKVAKRKSRKKRKV